MVHQQIKMQMSLMVLILQLIIITSQNTAKKRRDTQLPQIVKQLKNVKVEQHSKYITHQNEEAKSQETKNRLMITDVNLASDNISAESPKESKHDDRPK